MNEQTAIPMPEPIPKVRRVPKETVDQMKPGDFMDLEPKAAAALKEAIKYRGWVAVQRKLDDNLIRIWRYA